MTLQIVPLEAQHLEGAAALAARRCRALRRGVPALPARCEQESVLLPLLRQAARPGAGAAALDGGRLVGFLSGLVLPSFRGQRSAFSPEWANGAEPEDSRRIYEELYTRQADCWAADGCAVHLVSLLPHDEAGLQAWQWLGFGGIAADAVRDLEPLPGPAAAVPIRRLGSAEAGLAHSLRGELAATLAAAPTFLPRHEPPSGFYEEWLADPRHAFFAAYRGAEAAAMLQVGPANPDAAEIVQDPGTAGILAAYARPESRGAGMVTALLGQALQWARAEGYVRLAVDFEPMNPPATRFWLRHFRLVSYTVQRRVAG